jgi:hypothetical protein
MQKQKTPEQNRTLNYLLNRAGLFGEDARDTLETACGKRRRRDMDFGDHQRAIKYLNDQMGKPLQSKKPRKPRELRPGGTDADRPTMDHVRYLYELLEQMGATGTRRTDWVWSQIQKEAPSTRGELKRLTEAAKAMRARGYNFLASEALGIIKQIGARAKHGPEWTLAIDAWWEIHCNGTGDNSENAPANSILILRNGERAGLLDTRHAGAGTFFALDGDALATGAAAVRALRKYAMAQGAGRREKQRQGQ